MLQRLVILILCIALTPDLMGQQRKTFTLVIDAGHGGKDSGAKGKRSLEKDINLKTALAFGRLVERNCPDVKVIYTRKTDVFVTLSGRAEIANKAKADLFISIHTNSMPKGAISRGIETYTLGMHRAADNLEVAKRENSVILVEDNYKTRYQGFDPNSSESYIIFELMQDVNMERSVALAKAVQKNLCRQTGRANKGVKQAGFLVLRETSMPSCLIELGFISTPDEEQRLIDPDHVSAMARGIYNAFAEYKNKYAQNTRRVNSLPVEKSQMADDLGDKSNVNQTEKTVDTLLPRTNDTTLQSQVEPIEPMNQPIEQTDAPNETENKLKEIENNPKEQAATDVNNSSVTAAPVFKVQILTSDSKLKNGDKRLKGITDYDYYKENGLFKYTSGASENYNEIYRLRKKLIEKFPQAFIIAFKNGQKMDVQQALREFKQNKNR